MPIKRVVIMVTDGPYQSLRPYSALRYALAAMERGVEEVMMIFTGDGIHCLKGGVGKGSSTVGDFSGHIKKAMENGIMIRACDSPMKLYKLGVEDLIEGVEVAEGVIDYILDEQTRVLWL